MDIILYTTNQFDNYFNKKYNTYLYGPIYFLKNFKNHFNDDTWLRKRKWCNIPRLIHRR